MKVLIVEDEITATEKLRKILLQLDPKIEIVGCCESVYSTTEFLQNNASPDLIFLDIQLTDGISFEIFKNVQVNCPVIFVTAFNQFALKAFKVNSVDYILKPYVKDEIAKSIEKYNKYSVPLSQKQDKNLYAELSKAISPNFKTRFFTKLNNSVYSIKTEDLIYIKHEDKTTILVDSDNRNYVTAYSLDALDDGLLDPKKFFRINRQFIIGFNSIEKMDISAKGRIGVKLIKLDEKEYVSRSKTKEFKMWLDQ